MSSVVIAFWHERGMNGEKDEEELTLAYDMPWIGEVIDANMGNIYALSAENNSDMTKKR